MANLCVHMLICIGFTCFLLFAPRGEAVECQDVVKDLVPCMSYLRGTGGPVPGECCSGVRDLNRAASTTLDRRTACECIKKYSGQISGLNPNLVGSLPESCGVHLSFVPSSNTDCARFHVIP
ncbi:unnamed protein product [Victoria cruziana]